jgi:hypothetical protein
MDDAGSVDFRHRRTAIWLAHAQKFSLNHSKASEIPVSASCNFYCTDTTSLLKARISLDIFPRKPLKPGAFLNYPQRQQFLLTEPSIDAIKKSGIRSRESAFNSEGFRNGCNLCFGRYDAQPPIDEPSFGVCAGCDLWGVLDRER